MLLRRQFNLRNSAACVAVLLACACAPAASASAAFATWTAASGSTASGTLDGVSFTITGLDNAGLTTADLSGGYFSAYPGSSSQQALTYAEESNYTVTFATPIAVLYVYQDYWRPEDLADYDFSQAISIASGDSNTTVVGGTDLDATNYNNFINGVVELTNVTSFTVTQNFSDVSYQNLDFAGTAGVATPEPGSLAVVTLGVAALLLRRRLAGDRKRQ
jgi:hypothetical protein